VNIRHDHLPTERSRKRKAQAAATIVTAKNPRRGRFGEVPDMTPEEHKRRGDAADALFREMKRQIAEKLREE
jgi:hypothetical protein